MDMRAYLASLAAVALLSTACSGGDPAVANVQVARSSLQRDRAPVVSPATQATAVKDNNAFAADLQARLVAGGADQNLFFSGYSVSSAFAMLYPGARGETATAIAKALRYSLGGSELHPAMNRIALDLESRALAGGKGSDGKGFRLAMNNAFWGEKTTTWEAPYLDTIATSYDAGVNLVDFVHDHDASRKTINAWTEAKTEKRIKELLSSDAVDAGTRFVLVNTVYFNAAWLEEFGQVDLPFTGAKGSKTVPAITQTSDDLKYGANEDAEVVAIPYEGRQLEMVVVLPKSLAALEDGLDGAKLGALLDLPTPHNVALTMPKIKIEGKTISLKPELSAMGAANIFTDAADFSGMTKGGGLLIDDVYHQAFVKVNEKGTEAAAATAIVGRETAAVVDPPKVVKVDRPYLFFVRDVPTKQVLFTGRVVEPTYAE